MTRVCVFVHRRGTYLGKGGCVPTLAVDEGRVPTVDGRGVPTLDSRGVLTLEGVPTLVDRGGVFTYL